MRRDRRGGLENFIWDAPQTGGVLDRFVRHAGGVRTVRALRGGRAEQSANSAADALEKRNDSRQDPN